MNVRLFVLPLLLALLGASCAPPPASTINTPASPVAESHATTAAPAAARQAELRALIVSNLHLNAHSLHAVDQRTLDAVRPHISATDVPPLVALLGDRQAAVGYAASHLLAALGPVALSALHLAIAEQEPEKASKAKEAIAEIEAASASADATRGGTGSLLASGEVKNGSVDSTCKTSADCAVKNVGNCCGQYPACVNKDSRTFPDQVRAQCSKEHRMGVCGFPAIHGCECVAGKCESQKGVAANPIAQ